MSQLYMHYHDENAICECEDCGHECVIGDLEMITDFEERVAPGEETPAGECPKCRSLSHLKNPGPTWLALLAFAKMMAGFTTPEDEFNDPEFDHKDSYDDVDEMVSDMSDERLCGEYATFMEMIREARSIMTPEKNGGSDA